MCPRAPGDPVAAARGAAAAVALAALAALACTSSTPPPSPAPSPSPRVPSCITDADCQGGEECRDGVCGRHGIDERIDGIGCPGGCPPPRVCAGAVCVGVVTGDGVPDASDAEDAGVLEDAGLDATLSPWPEGPTGGE